MPGKIPGHDGITAAPMASAPLRYADDGSVAWDDMWDSFCALAQEGGPPHRGTMLDADPAEDTDSEAYRAAAAEIIRGIALVSGLAAAPGAPGWIVVSCPSAAMAGWLAEAIVEERVAARAEGANLLVPVGASYTVKGEIKNVVTVVAKTTHYWHAHVPAEAKQALAWQAYFGGLRGRVMGWFRRGTVA